MKTPGLPRALLVVGGLALAVAAGIGTADSFGGEAELWGDLYDPDADHGGVEQPTTVLRAPAIRATIDSLHDELRGALEDGDFETVAELYADDAVYLPAMAIPVRGKEAILTRLRAVASDRARREFRDREVRVLSPEWATEHGTVVVRGDEESVNPATELSYSLLYRKTGDGWTITRDVRSAHAAPSDGR